MTQTFTAHAAALKRALAFASQVTKRRASVPILGMVRIDVADTTVTITGTDLDVECEATLPATEFEKTGPLGKHRRFSFTIDPKMLRSMLRWASGEVTISREDDLITIKADGVATKVRDVYPVSDWPALPMGEAFGLPIAVTGAGLRKALRATVPAISTDPTLYHLNGVFLEDDVSGLRAVATDGYHLAIYDTHEGWGLPDMTLPSKAARILLKALPLQSNGAVRVTATRRSAEEVPRLQIKGDDWIIRTKSIDGKFPDYTCVIPTAHDNISVTIGAAQLRRFPATLRSAAPVKIHGDAGMMSTIMSSTTTLDTNIEVPIQGHGEAFGVNIKYLKDFADFSEPIRLEGSGKGEPFRVLNDDPNFLGILMPMRI